MQYIKLNLEITEFKLLLGNYWLVRLSPGSVVFPVDFFEHCSMMNDIEYGGNDLLQVYNVQQLKNRLNSQGGSFYVYLFSVCKLLKLQELCPWYLWGLNNLFPRLPPGVITVLAQPAAVDYLGSGWWMGIIVGGFLLSLGRGGGERRSSLRLLAWTWAAGM